MIKIPYDVRAAKHVDSVLDKAHGNRKRDKQDSRLLGSDGKGASQLHLKEEIDEVMANEVIQSVGLMFVS